MVHHQLQPSPTCHHHHPWWRRQHHHHPQLLLAPVHNLAYQQLLLFHLLPAWSCHHSQRHVVLVVAVPSADHLQPAVVIVLVLVIAVLVLHHLVVLFPHHLVYHALSKSRSFMMSTISLWSKYHVLYPWLTYDHVLCSNFHSILQHVYLPVIFAYYIMMHDLLVQVLPLVFQLEVIEWPSLPMTKISELPWINFGVSMKRSLFAALLKITPLQDVAHLFCKYLFAPVVSSYCIPQHIPLFICIYCIGSSNNIILDISLSIRERLKTWLCIMNDMSNVGVSDSMRSKRTG